MNLQDVNETVDSMITMAERHRAALRKPHDEIIYAEVAPKFHRDMKACGSLDYLEIAHNIIVTPREQ